MIERIDPISSQQAASITPATRTARPSGPAFDQVLTQAMTAEHPLKFSAHAQRRLQSRDIALGEQDLSKIEKAVDKAGQKGSRESLVLLDDVALVVSIRNRVVITALNVPDIKDNIVTNIDSVVMA